MIHEMMDATSTRVELNKVVKFEILIESVHVTPLLCTEVRVTKVTPRLPVDAHSILLRDG